MPVAERPPEQTGAAPRSRVAQSPRTEPGTRFPEPTTDRPSLPPAPLTLPPPDRLSWQEFLERFDWQQGEHVTLVGPTGAGKTTLALHILPRRSYVAIFATKPRDDVMARVEKAGYTVVKDWSPQIANHIALWPPIQRVSDLKRQKEIFEKALASIYASGGWTLFCDEAFYLTNQLKLGQYLELLWTQGRSLGVSLVAATQRPAHISLFAYDMATHLFFWRDNDERNLERIGGLGGLAAKPIRRAVSALEKHEVLYVNTRNSEMYVTKVEV